LRDKESQGGGGGDCCACAKLLSLCLFVCWVGEWFAMVQNFNAAGVAAAARMLWDFKSMSRFMLPHISVRTVQEVNFAHLRQKCGFRAVLFDKDNTLTEPYARSMPLDVKATIEECVELFGKDRVGIVSNSAGSSDDSPPRYPEACSLEADLGIKILHHGGKKPEKKVITAAEDAFGCVAQDMIMVGDRYLTDIMFGNMHGLLSVYTHPLCDSSRDPATVKVLRPPESWLVQSQIALGKTAPTHPRFHQKEYDDAAVL